MGTATYIYPREHFILVPWRVKGAIKRAMDYMGVRGLDWRLGLEAIACYESSYQADPGIGVCLECRGMFQSSKLMFKQANDLGILGPNVRQVDAYYNPELAARVAIAHIQGRLPGFGGYGGMKGLLARTDRGPGNVLATWSLLNKRQAGKGENIGKLRPLYRGY